jgi:hypothetical protein
MGRAIASDVRTLDAALAERERVLRVIRAHHAELRRSAFPGSGSSVLLPVGRLERTAMSTS